MTIYKKVRMVFLSFNNKVIREINFGKTSQKSVKLKVPAIRFNDRSFFFFFLSIHYLNSIFQTL